MPESRALSCSEGILDGTCEREVQVLATEVALEVVQVQSPHHGCSQLPVPQVPHLSGVAQEAGLGWGVEPAVWAPPWGRHSGSLTPAGPPLPLRPGTWPGSYLGFDTLLLVVPHPLVARGGIGDPLAGEPVHRGSSKKVADLSREQGRGVGAALRLQVTGCRSLSPSQAHRLQW